MVEQALSALFYASHSKEMKQPVLKFLDSLIIHFTLISLSLYTNQDDTILANLNNFATLNMHHNQQQQQQQHQQQPLDFLILVDSLYEVLCNDDSEYWCVVQRAVVIMIETSEVITYANDEASSSSSSSSSSLSLFRPNLANLALFDYLAEKVCQLCYERSWYAKKAGCLIVRLLSKRMPFIWVIQNCYLFIRSLMFILVAVTSEVYFIL
jgi:transformation/transcription domain-associated protein